MIRGAEAARSIANLARIGFRVGDEFRNRLGWNRWRHYHYQRLAANARDRRDIAEEIEIEFVVESRIDRVGWTDQKKRVAICGRANDCLGADIATCAWPVLDHEWLAETLRQPLAH